MHHIGAEGPGGGNSTSRIFGPSPNLSVSGDCLPPAPAPHHFYLFLFHGSLDLCLGSKSCGMGPVPPLGSDLCVLDGWLLSQMLH